MSDTWWRGGVIYQIYPRSFADGNGDGVGDLPGLTGKLDYIHALGVDAIWISPFFKSPMKDFGYDVSDYRDVDPQFGSLDDFDRLIARAHALGLKVIVDQVLSHSSDQHAWFAESRADRDNPRADWYVWAHPRADGTPPTNWLSVFGGPAWQWDTRRRQFYLHNFLASQPDLNFHHPDVQRQMIDEVRFWLDRGVDGLRFDACNFHFHDKRLRNNPPVVAAPPSPTSVDNPYAMQRHRYDKTRPENLTFLKRLRRHLDDYRAVGLGEVGDDDALATMARYTADGDKLHMTYSFDLLTPEFSAAHVRGTVERMEARLAEHGGKGWVCWSASNHDVPRVVSRWGDGRDAGPDFAKLVLTLIATLRGTPCVYQGEELGLTEARIPYEQLRDPVGIEFWPGNKGRDGCRTPLPWRASEPHCGFSSSDTWLPIPDEHASKAVDLQHADPASPLNFFRHFLAWRRLQQPLRDGSIRFLDAPEPILAFERAAGADRRLLVFNLGGTAQRWPLPDGLSARPCDGHGLAGASLAGRCLTLAPHTAWIGHVTHAQDAR
ncbi:alpha-glucosidase [Burkholderia sp. Bp9143]|uniref:alpha-glucosidase n=1 Tax=Burkholderia sp. Bp9143 TaxID=2184574 RepID=UPI000F5997EF|nr:alpha-glucosidase [Burkholderia sp. Bp9143]RQR34392.1 alpha-glucosidase [Burkholderia sp. Bp9143]